MPRGLDPLVHVVRDLDAAGAFYRRLGFTVGARNRHPWGTHNRIVQLSGFFIELLTVAEPDKLGNDGFSTFFGEHHRDFLSQREGFSFLMLESHDTAADAQAFHAAGIALSDGLRFERGGRAPDGSPRTVAFSLVFARDNGVDGPGFALCQQHTPEQFWNPELQRHTNTVQAAAGVVAVADEPDAHRAFLSAF